MTILSCHINTRPINLYQRRDGAQQQYQELITKLKKDLEHLDYQFLTSIRHLIYSHREHGGYQIDPNPFSL